MKIAILGAGAWGTTIAIHLAQKGHDVLLWARDEERARQMEASRENERYLRSFRLPDRVHVTAGDPGGADALIGAIPTQPMRTVLTRLRPSLPRAPFLSLSKGIEIGTGQLPTQIYADVAGAERPRAVLTGPCISSEVVRGLPTAVVVAGDEARMWQELFNTDRFRVYTGDDPVGAELVGALKNVMGIAAGIVDGMGFGDNAKAALLTRSIVEITRLGLALGAQAQTFTGLAGFGDLFTTCVSPHGRNRGLGERIGRGERLDEILASTSSIAEGVPTTRAVLSLARGRGVEMPITSAIHSILFEGIAVEQALGMLMSRDRRPER